ncbi:MAG: hypothetical protein KC561_21705, partial [Myxococcales bacterium]|nr:hypothetical protein [Myxococcales bacterium]
LGTPNDEPCVRTIAQIRNEDARFPPGALIRVENVLVTRLQGGNNKGAFITDQEGGDYSGILAFSGSNAPTDGDTAIEPGMIVNVEGTYGFFNSLDEILTPEFEIVSSGNTVTPIVVTLSQLEGRGEQWESQLLKVEDVYVIEFLDGDGSGSNDDEFLVAETDDADCDTEFCLVIGDFQYNGAGGNDTDDLPAASIGAHFDSIVGV